MHGRRFDSGLWAASLCACVALTATEGRAQSGAQRPHRVLVFNTPKAPQRRGLTEALRIQLGGIAHVSDGGVLPGGTLSHRVQEGVLRIGKRSAVLGVWVEGPAQAADGTQELLLVLLGSRHGRAVVEVLRLPGGDGPEVDRSLALKTRAALDTLLEGREPIMLDDKGRADHGRGAAATDAADRWVWGWILDAGAVATTLEGSDLGQWGLSAGGGIRLQYGRWSLHGRALFRLCPSLEARNAEARVLLQELAPGTGASALLRLGRVAIGPHLGFHLRLVSAEGISPAGNRGSDTVLIPALLSAVQGQLALQPWLALRLALGLEVASRGQAFAVNRQTVAQSDRVRPFGELAVVLLGP